MDKHAVLPKLEFFTQKNMTTGSLTPEDLIGRPLEPIFNYRVWAQDGRLAAAYYIDSRCYELTDKDKICRGDFDLSPEGIRAAEQWLDAEYVKYEKNVEVW